MTSSLPPPSPRATTIIGKWANQSDAVKIFIWSCIQFTIGYGANIIATYYDYLGIENPYISSAAMIGTILFYGVLIGFALSISMMVFNYRRRK